MFEEKEIIDNIELAISLLKNNKLLFTFHLNKKIYFVEKKKKVLVLSENYKYSLSYDEFKELYEKASFIIYEESEDRIDFSRDDEYYSWKHK